MLHEWPCSFPSSAPFILPSIHPSIHPPSIHPSIIHPTIHSMCLLADHSSTPASDKNPSRGLAQISTLPPLTYNTRSKLPTSPRTETPLLPMTTASLSSPGLEVNPTHKTDVIRYGFQVSGPLVCTRSPLVSSPCAERMWGVKGEEGWGTGADLSHLSLVEPPRGGRGRC